MIVCLFVYLFILIKVHDFHFVFLGFILLWKKDMGLFEYRT